VYVQYLVGYIVQCDTEMAMGWVHRRIRWVWAVFFPLFMG